MNHALTIRMSAAGAPVTPNTVWTKEPSTTIKVVGSLAQASMSANNRILLSKAGKYLILARASILTGVAVGLTEAAISKNGAAPTAAAIAQGSSKTIAGIGATDLAYAALFDTCDGNDFYELWLNASAATTTLVGAKYTLECYEL